MAHALCMLDNKTTEAHSEYVTLVSFPQQQCLGERASMLRYTYIVYPVCFLPQSQPLSSISERLEFTGLSLLTSVLTEGINELGQKTTFLGPSIGLLRKLRNFSFKLHKLYYLF